MQVLVVLKGAVEARQETLEGLPLVAVTFNLGKLSYLVANCCGLGWARRARSPLHVVCYKLEHFRVRQSICGLSDLAKV